MQHLRKMATFGSEANSYMKQVDVIASIGELLYERDSVIVPGFGGFVSNYQQANIDHVQGLLHPPAKQLDFNDNLSLNDGVLVDYLQKKYQVTEIEALDAVNDFVLQTKEALENREIVVFPKIGRLYLDFEQQFKFLQDNTNFNADSYGLPTVQFYPVVRYQRSAVREIHTTAVKNNWRNPLRGNSNRISSWFQTSMPWIILLSIIIIALSIYFINREPTRIAENNREPLPSERVNTPPERNPPAEERIIVEQPEEQPEQSEEQLGDEQPVDDLAEEEETIPTPPVERTRPRPELDTEAPTVAPNIELGVVIIGAFRNLDNAEDLIEEVYAAGYDAYSDVNGRSTRVGVQISYSSQAELERRLEEIREVFNSSAWILD